MNNLDQYFNQFQHTRNQQDFARECIKKHYSNGLSQYTQKISIYTSSDINECKDIWEQFSPHMSMFDTWEVRSAFQESYKHNVKFVCLLFDSQLVAVLPLSFNTYLNQWGWLGTDWPEDNKFFALDPIFLPLLLFLSPRPICLGGITQEERDKVRFVEFENDDSKYVKNISEMHTLEDFLKTLNKKKRYNLKKDLQRINALSPEVIINSFDHYPHINRLTEQRFSGKNALADWQEQPEIIDTFQKFIEKNNLSYEARMISLLINNEVCAVDLLCIYKDTYYTLKGGYDVKRFPGIGNYMNLLEIKDAIELGQKSIDFLQIDYGWKHQWFDEIPLYKYTNGPMISAH